MKKDAFELHNQTEWNDCRKPLGSYVTKVNNGESNNSFDVAVFHEHQIAFYYWVRAHALRRDKLTIPDLITIDLHTDVADPDNVDILSNLNISDAKAVASLLYSGEVLRYANDRQILSAQYRNLIRDAYILHCQEGHGNFTYPDIERNEHNLFHFDTIEDLVDALKEDHVIRGFLDIDCDYFTNNEDNVKETRTINESKFDIFNSELMKIIGQDLELITIALEPEHCGGFSNCFEIFNKLQSKLFEGELFDENCRLKYEKF